jgi:Concanavalin A-like lectin/glucanases superfamily
MDGGIGVPGHSKGRWSLFAALFIACMHAGAQTTAGLAAQWSFDDQRGKIVHDSVSGQDSPILNNYQWVKGVSGDGLKFDGFTTVVELAPKAAPKIGPGFTVESWIAMQSYPWNWVPIVDQHQDEASGYFFGIDAEGRLGLQLSVWGIWNVCRSDVRIPLKRWTHVAAVYDPATGVSLYIDGKPAGKLPLIGDFVLPRDTPFRIGRNLIDLPPIALVRPKASFPALYSFDGIFDDLRIYDRPLSSTEIASAYNPTIASMQPEMTERRWPVLPGEASHLKAVYTDLHLYPEWDALWRTGPASDVVVSFKNLPFHYVFWRGANYGPNMVTENSIWMSDQSFESGTKIGTAEHMNDKHNMHASISILETTNARVVLHWRYALVDVTGGFAGIDHETGWSDWVDELFYIYPDGLAVRRGTIHGKRKEYSFTEPTLLLEPGKKPEDYVSLQAATVINSKGENKTYSWAPDSPPFPFPDQPTDANIALVNLHSKYKPFYIYKEGTELGPYGWPPELRLQYSHFPVWDHWPVNQIPSDGRFELFPDHYASAAIMSPNPNAVWIEGPGPTKTTYFLFGLTDGSVEHLAQLDRSWLHPPDLRMDDEKIAATYDPGQRAYLLTGVPIAGKGTQLKFTIDASESSPVVNPAFVIKGWGQLPPVVRVDGASPGEGDVESGFIDTLSGTDLVLWLRKTATSPVHVSLTTKK